MTYSLESASDTVEPDDHPKMGTKNALKVVRLYYESSHHQTFPPDNTPYIQFVTHHIDSNRDEGEDKNRSSEKFRLAQC